MADVLTGVRTLRDRLRHADKLPAAVPNNPQERMGGAMPCGTSVTQVRRNVVSASVSPYTPVTADVCFNLYNTSCWEVEDEWKFPPSGSFNPLVLACSPETFIKGRLLPLLSFLDIFCKCC